MRHPRWLPDALALAGLALLALIFFWPVTFHLGWIPRGGGDLVSFLWPTYRYAAQSLWAGRVPLWNPTLYAGMPFAADNQSGVFYPIHWFAFLLAPTLPYRALEALVIFHVWLAGAGMYALLRALLIAPAPRLPALFAAIAFMFSEVLLTHIGNLNIVAVAAWLPLAFCAAHLALARRSWRWAMLGGAVLSMAVLAGHAQLTLIVFGVIGLYGLWETASTGPRILFLTGLIFTVALGLSAVALWPAIELTQHTGRARLDYAAAAEYSLPWPALAGLFSPLVFGRGAADFWGPWPRVEAGYLGVLTLLLAGSAPFKTRRALTLFFIALAALGLLIALGAHTPVHYWLYRLVPGFAQLRVPARFILLTDFALAVLAGLGLAHRPPRAGWAALLLLLALGVMGLAQYPLDAEAFHRADLLWGSVIVVSLIGAALMIAAVPALRRAAPALAVVLLAADLIGHGAWVEVDAHDPTLGFQHPGAVAYLQSQPGPTRIDNASGAWQPDAAAMFGLEDIGGISNPLGLAAYQTYLGAVGPRGTPLYNFLNAQFVIADKGQPPGDSSFVPVFNEDPHVDVYLNTNAMPRVSLVYVAETVASGEAAFAAIHAAGFNPAQTVVIENGPPLNQPAPQGEANLFYLNYQPEAFAVQVIAPAPAYVVFSEVWYPGWRAQVDGADAPIYKANFAFRAVRVEAGEHTVALRFAPRSWALGLSLSVLTLAGLIAALVWRRR